MANYFDRPAGGQLQIGAYSVATKAGLALNGNYSFGATGPAVLLRFTAPVSANLTKVYFFVSATNGIPGVTTVELRENTAAKPNATLRASQTVSPGTTANKWIACTFGAPYSVVQGVQYWVCIGDAAGDGTNYATVVYTGGLSAIDLQYYHCRSYSTTDGCQNVTSRNLGAIVLKFADGTLFGNPFTNAANDTSNTLMRGLHIEGLTEKITIIGVHFDVATYVNGLKIFSGSAGPDDSADVTATGDATQGIVYFASPVTLQKSTIYNIVCTYSASGLGPNYYSNEDNSQADCIACGFGGGTIYRCIDNSVDNTWALDTSKFPRMALIVQDQVAAGGMLQANKRGNKI